MSRSTSNFELQATPGLVRSATAKALEELGWTVWPDNDQTIAREDPAGLCCSMAPVEVRIFTTEIQTSRTAIEFRLSVPGFGPAPTRQLADRSAGLEQRIRRWTTELGSV